MNDRALSPEYNKLTVLGIFSWSSYEPYEGEYHFEWLIEIMDKLYENGISTILATPSGARPVMMHAENATLKFEENGNVII